MNPEIRLNIRLRWLNSLYELSHLNFQKELWIEAKFPDIVGSFDEAICSYYDDLNLSEGYNHPDNIGIYEPSERQAVSAFHHDLSNYLAKPEKQSLSDSKILKDPEWLRVTEVGRISYDLIKQNLIEPKEIRIIKELENKYGK